MKRCTAIISGLALAVALTGMSFAQCGKGGCGSCPQGQAFSAVPGDIPATSGQPDPYRQFISNTIDLRQEMMLKRFDLQRENLKGVPDAVRVAALKTDIARIQAQISEIRTRSGLDDIGKLDGECGKMGGECFKMNGECGRMGGGCGEQPCWRK